MRSSRQLKLAKTSRKKEKKNYCGIGHIQRFIKSNLRSIEGTTSICTVNCVQTGSIVQEGTNKFSLDQKKTQLNLKITKGTGGGAEGIRSLKESPTLP